MKPFPKLLSSGMLAGLALGIAPARSQDLRLDTLAVRVLLDRNGLTAVPASQVAGIDPAAQRVTSLRLGGLKLTALTPEIGSLDALEYLVLSDNLLDSLPAALWDLRNLVELDLGGNRVAALDPGVGRLGSLLFLGLRGNGLSALPDSLFGLPNLETLLLTGNALDTLPEAVGGMAFLRYLDVSGNALRALPYTIAALGALDTLDVSENALENLPPSVASLPGAATVRLEGNRLCHLSADLEAWADAKDPGWKGSQVCAGAIRPAARAVRGPRLRAFAAVGRLRVQWSAAAGLKGEGAVILRNAMGREVARRKVEAGTTEIAIPIPASGFLWAELREGNRLAARAEVAP
jgi:hypothetical protein